MIAISGLEVKDYYITREGAEELKQQLENLKLGRVRLLEEVRGFASESGSVLDDPILAHNFHKAEEMDAQIARLQRILARVRIIKQPVASWQVQLGSRVMVDIGGVTYAYAILGPLEADPAQGKISNESPLGRQLLGRKVGDGFELVMRNQSVSAKVTSIE